MPPPPDLSSFRLSPATSHTIFTTRIVPRDIDPFPESPTPNAPEAVLAVGQTGAGKTRLCPVILDALRTVDRQPVHLIADVYKTYHPAYADSAILPAHLASAATGPDARGWLRMAVEEAARRRLDVLLESACRHPDDFTDLAELLGAAGYRLTVVIMAVPAPLSRLGTVVRFYRDLPEARSGGLPLRLTPVKVHDDSYEGLSRAVEWLDRTGVADRVVLLRRGNLVSYVKEAVAGTAMAEEDTKRRGPDFSLSEALARERRRPLTFTERSVATEDLKLLEDMPKAHEHLVEIRSLLEPLLSGPAESHESDLPSLRPLRFLEEPADHETSARRVMLTAG